ncbi:MAG: carbohydrate ABC transporter permease [Clostridia bacterium]|nr:carbohydrate ABC transporter permease [Clostridia bacterium]
MTERMIRGRKDTALDIVVYIIMILFAVIFLYPLVFVLSNSISASDAVLRREVWLWPVGFSLESYRLVFSHQYVLHSYLNSFLYTGLGTAYSVALTILGAYPLSRRYLPFRDFFMLLIAFTMMFSGGLIPTYLLVRDLGLLNKVWAMVLPCAVTPFNLILLRTSMQEIPAAIEESAKIDGAGDFTILVRIILPMCFASVATITLLYVMAKWNDWFNAMIYLNDHSKYSLRLL